MNSTRRHRAALFGALTIAVGLVTHPAYPTRWHTCRSVRILLEEPEEYFHAFYILKHILCMLFYYHHCMLIKNKKSMEPAMRVIRKARRSRFHCWIKLITSAIVISSVTKSAVAVRSFKAIDFLINRWWCPFQVYKRRATMSRPTLP
jgi:hypothetical protein